MPLPLTNGEALEGFVDHEPTVAEVIDHHVTLELESLDRVSLNVDQPELQTPRAVCQFLRDHPGQEAVSSHQRKAISERFLQSVDHSAHDHDIPIIGFENGQRKEDVQRSTWRRSRFPRGCSSSAKPR